MFDDRLVTNRALLEYKKCLFDQVGIFGIFPKGIPYEFSPELKNYSLVFFWKIYA